MTIYQDYRSARDTAEEAYSKLKQESGRFVIGPSHEDGIYIKDVEANITISRITKDEAQFLALGFMKIYGE